jgi:hypothetical protein
LLCGAPLLAPIASFSAILGQGGAGAWYRSVAADNPGSFLDDTLTAKLVRQVLGAISEFDKPMTGLNPALVALAMRLRRQKPKGGRMSLRAISAELAAMGYLNERGRPFSAASINVSWAHEEACEAKPARGRASRLQGMEVEAAADLANRHTVAPGTIPERLWRKLYIEAGRRRRLQIRRQCPPTTRGRLPIG